MNMQQPILVIWVFFITIYKAIQEYAHVSDRTQPNNLSLVKNKSTTDNTEEGKFVVNLFSRH